MVFQTLMSFWWFAKWENEILANSSLRKQNFAKLLKTMNFSLLQTLTCFITKTITKQTNKRKMKEKKNVK